MTFCGCSDQEAGSVSSNQPAPTPPAAARRIAQELRLRRNTRHLPAASPKIGFLGSGLLSGYPRVEPTSSLVTPLKAGLHRNLADAWVHEPIQKNDSPKQPRAHHFSFALPRLALAGPPPRPARSLPCSHSSSGPSERTASAPPYDLAPEAPAPPLPGCTEGESRSAKPCRGR